MHWIAPSEKNADNAALEKRLWDAADQLCANSELKSQEYSAPVLSLIFLLTKLIHPLFAFAGGKFALEEQRELHVLKYVEYRHQIEALKNKPNGV